jgi:hypothetical protein
MTLAPTNEAVRRENCVDKKLDTEKNNVMIREVMEDVRMVLLSKKHKIL